MTLTQASVLTKRGLIVFAALILLMIIGKLGYDFWYTNIYLPSLPQFEEQAEKKFGSLPSILIDESKKLPANLIYNLDTTTGSLPENPRLIKVYFIPQSGFSLLVPDRAKSLASQLGFNSLPQVLSDTKYKFTDNLGGSMTVDLITANFAFERPVATASAQLSAGPLPSATLIEKDFRDYLTKKGLLSEELAQGRGGVSYNSQPQVAETAEINIWQVDIDKLPVVTDSTSQALVTGLVTKYIDETSKYTKLSYTLWPIDLTTYSTYPLISATQALSNLKLGSGYLLTPPNQKNPVSITSVYIAYFQSRTYSPYLQPVYVFEGPEFAAITAALVPN